MGARPRFHSSLAPGQGLTHAHVYMCSNPVRCNACKQAQLCIFTRVPTRWWSLPFPGRVCSGLTPVHQTSVHESECTPVSVCLYFQHNPPPPISRAMARLPFALRLRGWEVTAVGPDSPMPTPRHTPSPRLVTSLSEASPGPVSLSPRQLSRLFPL